MGVSRGTEVKGLGDVERRVPSFIQSSNVSFHLCRAQRGRPNHEAVTPGHPAITVPPLFAVLNHAAAVRYRLAPVTAFLCEMRLTERPSCFTRPTGSPQARVGKRVRRECSRSAAKNKFRHILSLANA
jgi:hypothetical protein